MIELVIGFLLCVLGAWALYGFARKRTTARKLKKGGRNDLMRKFRRDSWVLLVLALLLVLGGIWVIHPSIIFTPLGL